MATLTLCSELKATRADLEALPVPEPMGKKHFPIPHIDLVRGLDAAFRAYGLEIVEEQLGLNDNGLRLFAAVRVRALKGDLTSFARDGQDFAVGYRSGNDKSVSLKMAAGVAVFVCSNLELHGDNLLLNRKHTPGLGNGGLSNELDAAIGKYVVQQKDYVRMQDKARAMELGINRAKCLIYDAFRADVLPPCDFVKVDRNFFHPEPEWNDQC